MQSWVSTQTNDESYVHRWYFAMLSISGIFSVTFSVVFAFVADVTTDEDRSAAYGLVSIVYLTAY